MFLSPWENSSAPICESVELVRETLPTSSQAYRDASLWLGIAYLFVAWCVCLPILWRLRDHPNFRKTRPFWISVTVNIFLTAYICSFILRLYIPDNFPCAVLTILFTFTMQGMGAVLVIRALVFVVEGAIQKKMREERANNVLLGDDFDQIELPTRSALKAILQVGFGFGKLEDLALVDLVQVKRRGFLILILMYFIGIGVIGLVILCAVHPALLLCSGCIPFAELIVMIMCLIIPQTLMFCRIAVVGYRYGLGENATGVIQEALAVSFFAMPFIILGLIFIIVDPGNVAFDNKFPWEWFVLFAGSIVLIFSFAVPVAHTIRQISIARRIARRNSGRMFDIILDPTNEVTKEFESYAEQRLVVEHLHFLQDTAAYQRFGAEKGDAWKLQKAKILCGVFIAEGSEAEINISWMARRKTLESLQAAERNPTSATHELDQIFDQPIAEVRRMLEHGVWPEFSMQHQPAPRRSVRPSLSAIRFTSITTT